MLFTSEQYPGPRKRASTTHFWSRFPVRSSRGAGRSSQVRGQHDERRVVLQAAAAEGRDLGAEPRLQRRRRTRAVADGRGEQALVAELLVGGVACLRAAVGEEDDAI